MYQSTRVFQKAYLVYLLLLNQIKESGYNKHRFKLSSRIMSRRHRKKRVFCFKTLTKAHFLRGLFVQLFIAIPHRSVYDSDMATLDFSKF